MKEDELPANERRPYIYRGFWWIGFCATLAVCLRCSELTALSLHPPAHGITVLSICQTVVPGGRWRLPGAGIGKSSSRVRPRRRNHARHECAGGTYME